MYWHLSAVRVAYMYTVYIHICLALTLCHWPYPHACMFQNLVCSHHDSSQALRACPAAGFVTSEEQFSWAFHPSAATLDAYIHTYRYLPIYIYIYVCVYNYVYVYVHVYVYVYVYVCTYARTIPYITLHCLTLPYITLHYITFIPYHTITYHTIPYHARP